MNRKLVYSLSIFIFISFLYFLNPQKILAYCWTSQSMCEGWVGYPPQSPVCCHNSGGCPSTPCGQIGWYDYCKFSQCCSVNYSNPSGTCSISDPHCYTDFWYDYYVYARCSAVDSCLGGAQLNAGVCGTSGCEKGGVYKVCCANGGGNCPHSCSGSNYSGTCGSGCYSVIGSSCSGGGGGGVTPPPGGGGGCLTPYNGACPKGFVNSGGCCTCP